ncbi:Juvenile hormone-inducible protein [Culex quinquefasciatus]|uniref:Juvenile hormone-inducible protein n=1 Tax=Culex quinquefasciatus TaxID=7176 RepID=B0X959_CULQU|nr:Juvenile hormone-inducible protein [Culex quinquefasciatus]|eukprot:XP_001866181.1 Juvenile hormone-inducible protein [Culex quinquefasciatus]
MSEDQLGLAFDDKQTILQNYFKDTSTRFTIKSCKVTTFEEQRTGYLGDHHLLTIVINSGDNEEREITVFVKKLPSRIPKLANCLIELKAFSKETGLFRELLPRLAEFGRFAPECLFQKGEDLLVFRNVKLEGFKVLDGNRVLLDLDHLKQVLRALMRLHAASFALEAQLGKSLVEAFPAVLDENAWPDEKNHPRILELENIIGTLCDIIECHEQNASRKEYLLSKIPDCFRQVFELVKSSTVYRNTISHSDLWNNNIMFRLDDSGIPIDCLLVDFQLARYVPPAYDFDMLIFLTTTRDFRFKNMTSLQDFYYQSLKSELQRQKLDIEQILSQQEFQESCKFYQRAGAIDSFIINHATLLPRRFLDEAFSSVEQFDRFDQKFKTKLCLETFEEDPIYRSRIVDIIETLYEAFELF